MAQPNVASANLTTDEAALAWVEAFIRSCEVSDPVEKDAAIDEMQRLYRDYPAIVPTEVDRRRAECRLLIRAPYWDRMPACAGVVEHDW